MIHPLTPKQILWSSSDKMTVSIATKIKRGLKRDFRDWVLVGAESWWFYVTIEPNEDTPRLNISLDDNLKRMRIHSYANNEWLYLDDINISTFKVSMSGGALNIFAEDRGGDAISITLLKPIDKTKEYIEG